MSGSYLVNGDIAKSLLELKSSVSSSQIKVSEFMLNRNESPIVNENSKIDEVLSTIEKYDLGFTCVENRKKELIGIISMADIRKSLINNIEAFSTFKAEDIINKNPIIIKEGDSINNMLKTIQNHNFLISFIPVTNEVMKLVGLVTFFNLIKSES